MPRITSRSPLLVVLTILWSCTKPPADSPQASKEAAAESPPARIVLVTGATGRQGGAVARELIERGYAVRGLTRNPDSERASALSELGAEMVQGNFGNSESLRSAMDGIYGVFAMTDFWEHGFDGEVQHGKTLIDIASDSAVRHFVYTSVAGSDQGTGIPHFDSKYVVERHLAASGMPYSVVRPVSFLDNWQTLRAEILEGQITDPREPETRHQWIATRDIGFFVGEAFDNPDEWLGRTEDIAGVELTVAEFIALVSEALGKPIRHNKIDWPAFENIVGEEVTLMNRWFQDVGYAADVEGLRSRYPELTTASEYLKAQEWASP